MLYKILRIFELSCKQRYFNMLHKWVLQYTSISLNKMRLEKYTSTIRSIWLQTRLTQSMLWQKLKLLKQTITHFSAFYYETHNSFPPTNGFTIQSHVNSIMLLPRQPGKLIYSVRCLTKPVNQAVITDSDITFRAQLHKHGNKDLKEKSTKGHAPADFNNRSERGINVTLMDTF